MFLSHQLLHYFIKKSSISNFGGIFQSWNWFIINEHFLSTDDIGKNLLYVAGSHMRPSVPDPEELVILNWGQVYWQIIHVPVPPFPVVPGRDVSFLFQVSAICRLVPRSSWRDFRLSLICFFFFFFEKKKKILFISFDHAGSSFCTWTFFSCCSERGPLSSWAGRASLIAEWGL